MTPILPPDSCSDLAQLPDYLKMRDLCRLFSISPTAIRTSIAEGCLPAPIRFTRRTYRWRKSDIVAFLQEANHE